LLQVYPPSTPTKLLVNDGTAHFTIQDCGLPLNTWGSAQSDALPTCYSVSGDFLQIQHLTVLCALAPASISSVGGTLGTARFADVTGDGITDAVCLMADGTVRAFIGGPGDTWSSPVLSPI